MNQTFDEDIEFYGNNLWNYYDSIISNNYLSFDYYGFDKEKKISAPKFKLLINGKTANKDSKFIFDSCSLYKFTYQLKSEILKSIKNDIEKFKNDQKWSHGFSYTGYKKNIYVTIMWNDLSNSPVIRFMIGEKEKTILESDKVYVPLVEFFSLHEIFTQAFNNYVNLCSISSLESNIVRLQKCTDNISNSSVISDNLNKVKLPVINDVFDTSLSSNQCDTLEVLENISIGSNDTVKKVVISSTENSNGEVEKVEPSLGIESEQQNDFDDFLKANRDTFKLDLPEERKDPNNKDDIIKDSDFIKKLCNDKFSVFEQIMFNTSNEELPFDSFVNLLKNTLNIDFKKGLDNNAYNDLNYIISNTIKYNINQLLENKKKLPNSITPIVVSNKERSDEKIDVMYYLLIFYIYTSKIKVILSEKSNNSIDNKEYLSYVLKVITNPLVFSYFPDIPEEVIKSEVVKRYRKLKEIKFFDEFITKVQEKIKCVKSLIIDENDFNDNISKIYSNVVKFKDKLTVNSSYNSAIMKVPLNTLHQYDIELETLKKIIKFDISFYKYGKITDKIDLKCYDDVPVSILKIYGINVVKFDNTIITKFLNDNYKNLPDLEKIKKINKNVYDIIDDIDLLSYDDKLLKALYFWNTEVLPKNLSYIQFVKLINDSSLTKKELVSMIKNKEMYVDKSFYKSFLLCM